MKRISLVLMVLMTCTFLTAQKPPMKLGKVSKKDVEMKYYAPDSTVSAAILCEYGEFFPDVISFRWQRRIKIFKKEGLDYLIMTGPSETKGGVRGYVYNMVDGEVVREKISREHIYMEQVYDDYTRVRIAPPNAVEGSVVDIEFSFDGYLSAWQFQRQIPVLYSELRIPDNQYIKFRFQQIGYERVMKEGLSRYIARDMPAFKAEPFITSIDNYLTSLLIDISTIEITGVYSKAYASSWRSVCKHFWEDDQYGELLDNPNLFLNGIRDEINAKAKDRDEKIRMALDTVRAMVKWNEVSDLYPVDNFRMLIDEGTGTSSDINFLLLLLLNKLDIQALPMVMSTRSEGAVNPFFPTLSKLNYTIVCLPGPDGELLIDASDKYTPAGMLPERAINGGGFLVNGGGGRWVEFTPAESAKKMSSCNLVIEDDLSLHGAIMRKHEDYSALDFFREQETYTSEEKYLEAFESDHEGLLVNSYSCDKPSIHDLNVTETFEVEIEDGVSQVGSMLSLNPVILDRWDENPFKLEDRAYPVDFTTPRNWMYIMNITIPEGYEVEQLPEPVSITNKDNTLKYLYNIRQSGSLIQVMTRLDIQKPVFIQSEYHELKMLFNLVVSKEGENIILKKRTS